MLNSGKKTNEYSNSCVVQKKISERNKKPYPPPLQVKWSDPNCMCFIYVFMRLC